MPAVRVFGRNPVLYILLGVVMTTQLTQGFSYLSTGDTGNAATSLLLGSLGILAALLLARVPVVRINPDDIVLYKVPVRPETVPREAIAEVKRSGQKAYLVLRDGRQVEIPLAWALQGERDEIPRAIEAWLQAGAGSADDIPDA